MINSVIGMIIAVVFAAVGIYVESFAVVIISYVAFLVFGTIALAAYEHLKGRLSKIESELEAVSTVVFNKKPDFTNHDGSHDYD